MPFTLKVIIVLLACPWVNSQPFPSTLPFSIRLRDQTFENRQFESYNVPCGDPVSNICEQQLYGSNQDMIYRPTALRSSMENCCGCYYASCENITVNNYGFLFFQDYYHDTPGLNFAYDTQITFNLIDAINGVYSYNSTTFFPLNEMGYSREEWNIGGQYYNFGFTSELRVPFYYRGGEVFHFTGDDDIWIYVDDMLQCDLGGMHVALSCSFYLDDFGFVPNTTHSLSVFHAERHITQSNYQVTTTILPLDQPPKFSNASFSLFEHSNVTISVTSFVMDADSPNLFYYILSNPSNGTILNATTLQPIQIPSSLISISQPFIYLPKYNFYGRDLIYVVANDLQLNSTMGQITLNVVAVNNPPVFPLFGDFQLLVGEFLKINITATVDSNPTAVMYTIANLLKCGNGRIYQDPINGTLFEYVALIPGIENVYLQVSDIYGSSLSLITITIVGQNQNQNSASNNSNNPLSVIANSALGGLGGLPMTELMGIIGGGVVFVILFCAILICCLYSCCVSKRLEKKWEQEYQERNAFVHSNQSSSKKY